MAILKILKEILNEIEEDNPFNLILKGGTGLALYHLNYHRESEDLDFDTTNPKDCHKNLENYFLTILENMKKKGTINDYKKGKSGLATTNRYHMKLELKTHKTFYTKIDVDFVKPVENLKKSGNLFFYPIERIFIGKMITFTNREEFKDVYDIFYILPKIDSSFFKGNQKVIELIENLIDLINKKDILLIYKQAFRNIDLHFKGLNEQNVKTFISKLTTELNKFKNML
ncbi:nucleotidyl transferase AbiEii/AbiGii toxin family protein [Candidatus Woesearchaeota archaeon]|nr:nucleotidyl transferase AbiEii/AbiGii toxin family protein [Candidatus Woesearchaeota archaeon]